jgi:protein-S-isoprenylcysteine O-methyltransferase Ste14
MDNQKTASHSLRAGIRWIAQAAIFVLILAAILFLSAGTLDWLMAWVYLGVFFVCLLFNGIYLARRNPELLKERSEIKPRQGVEKWDVVLSALVRVLMPAALVVCGLDQRFGWAGAMPLAVQLLALAIGMWALILGGLVAIMFIVKTVFEDRKLQAELDGYREYARHVRYRLMPGVW